MAERQPLWNEFLRNVMAAQQVAKTFVPRADDEAEVRKSINRNFQLCHKSLKRFLMSCMKLNNSNGNVSLHSEIYQDINIDHNMVQQGVVTRGYPRTPDGSPNENVENISTSNQTIRLFKNGTPSPDFNLNTSEARNSSSMSRPPSPGISQNVIRFDNSCSCNRPSPPLNCNSKAETIRNSHFRGPTTTYSSQCHSSTIRPRSPSHSDRVDSSYDRRTRKRDHHSVRSRERRNRSSRRSSSTSRNRSHRHTKNNHSRRSQKSSQHNTTRRRSRYTFKRNRSTSRRSRSTFRRSRSTSRRIIRSPPLIFHSSPNPSIPSSTSGQSQSNRENQPSPISLIYENISSSASPSQNTNEQGTFTSSMTDYTETIHIHEQYSMVYYQSENQRLMPRNESYHESLRAPHPYYYPRRY